MNAAVAVGRVGGLAVALGVGLALTTGCAVAWADETGTASTSTSDSASSSATASASTSVSDEAGDTAPSSDAPASSSEPTPTAEPDVAEAPAKQSHRVPVRIKLPDPAEDTSTERPAAKNRHRAAVTPRTSPRSAESTPVETSEAVQTLSPVRPPQTTVATTEVTGIPARGLVAQLSTLVATASAGSVSAPAVMTTQPAAAPSVGGIINGLLAVFGIGPLAANSPLAPVEGPAMWGLLAWARKEFQRSLSITGQAAPAATTSLAAATVAAAPTTTPVAWLTGSGTMGPYLLPRTNNTATKFGIAGTDVGTMWDNGIADNPATAVDEHQILMAFGDTFSGTGMTGTWRSNVLLRSSDDNPADGITVPAGVMGDIFSGSPLSAPNFSRQIIKSPGYLGFLGREVTIIPTAGISVPYNNAYGSRQYVSYMSVKSWDTPGRWTTNYAAIAYSDDNGQTWTVAPSSIRSAGYYRTTTGYVSGNQNFQQSAFVRPPAGSPEANYVYMFGTPSGRGGTIYLSRVNQASVLDQTKYEYWNGSAWVLNKPSAATPILPATTTTSWFYTRKTYPSAGEMSVQYNTYLNKYVMMYADSANNVVMRTADRPEGPWSPPTTLVTSVAYPGLYAPMMDPWTTGQDIYWNMSMWGDYNVLLMHTRLV